MYRSSVLFSVVAVPRRAVAVKAARLPDGARLAERGVRAGEQGDAGAGGVVAYGAGVGGHGGRAGTGLADGNWKTFVFCFSHLLSLFPPPAPHTLTHKPHQATAHTHTMLRRLLFGEPGERGRAREVASGRCWH